MKALCVTMFALTVSAFALGANAPSALLDYVPSVEVTASQTLLGLEGIVGPTEVVIGELARLEVEGDKVAWDCVPNINDGQSFGEGNCKFVCSFRTRGLYTVVAAVWRNEEVEIMKFPIEVGMEIPDVVIVDPVDPEEPDNPLPIVVADVELVDTTVKWCVSTKANKSQCDLVATVFGLVVAEIESGKIEEVGKIVERTAILNGEIEINELANLLGKIQTYLTQEADAGRLDNMEQHLIVWKSIEQGLTQYAENP